MKPKGQQEKEPQTTLETLREQNHLLAEQNALLCEEVARLREQQTITNQKLQKLMGFDLSALPAAQRDVLQTIQSLPVDAFTDADALIARIAGRPMTESFLKNLMVVIRDRRWALVCGVCEAPSSLYWHSNNRYTERGRAYYSHSGENGSMRHGSMVSIPELRFCNALDRRRKTNPIDK